MKIVLFGEDLFTAAVLQSLLDDRHNDDGHKIEAVICPLYPSNQEYRGLQRAAQKNDIPFLHEKDVNADKIADLLLRVDPDLIVSVHCKKILEAGIFTRSRKGAINVHPSLLPKYRGLSPLHQALIHGDMETGVTIHFIDEGVDTGDILLQEPIPLTRAASIYDLQMKVLSVYKHLVPRAVRLIAAGNFSPRQQDAAAASWYGPLKDQDREIDLKLPTFDIYNLIRAVSKPYKGAWYNNITIWTSFIADPATEKALSGQFDTLGIYPMQDKLVIRLHDGILISDDFEIATT